MIFTLIKQREDPTNDPPNCKNIQETAPVNKLQQNPKSVQLNIFSISDFPYITFSMLSSMFSNFSCWRTPEIKSDAITRRRLWTDDGE